jgi:hypothetical protein
MINVPELPTPPPLVTAPPPGMIQKYRDMRREGLKKRRTEGSNCPGGDAVRKTRLGEEWRFI